jgi:protein-disulfide isomerase
MSENINIKKETLWKGLTGLFLVLLIISVYTGGLGRDSETEQAQPRAAAPSAPSPTVNVDMDELAEGFAMKGNKNAKVTIVEYSSFSCGYCNKVRSTLDQILKTYPNDVKIVYKHFNRGGTDINTAQATECAGEQNKFWEMHDEIFDKGSSGDLSSYASSIGLNVDSFETCLSSGKYVSKVEESTKEAISLGIRGTPGFIINGQMVSGAQPFENFKQVIDAALAK